jgi:membrane protease subunit HflK
MAWNEPGGNNNDPWKNRKGQDQGPPDLDEVFKSILGKFSGSGGNKSSKGGPTLSATSIIVIVGILVGLWFVTGLYTIKEAERGIVLRFGEYHSTQEPGLRWKPTFIDQAIPVDIKSIRNMPSAGFMLTEDENVVRVEMEIQYRVTDPFKYVFSVTAPDESLRQALDSAIRYVVGHSKMDDVLTSGREIARQQVWSELEGIVEPYNLGVLIVDVNFKGARPPEEVKAAFDDAIAAQEDEERFIREAEAYTREIEPRARGQVNRIAQEAQAYKQRITLEAQGEVARFEELLPQFNAAPEVTRERIYLDTLEQVYSSTSKIVIDSSSGGNMMYLPLDKILQQQNSPIANDKARNTIESLRDGLNDIGNTRPAAPVTGRERSRTGRN